MEIERINENTIKFYISYLDIENLGFQREEIWYNRERSEQLFWHMMDEVNEKEDFNPDSPLWIQVQAKEKGLEIIVTKAKISRQDHDLDDQDDDFDFEEEGTIEDILEDTFGKGVEELEDNPGFHEERLWMVVKFDDFEDVIQLSHLMEHDYEILEETLYYYEGNYYLYVQFSLDIFDDEDTYDDIVSKIMEYATSTDISLHVLEEYGKIIIEHNTFSEIRKYFPREI